MSEVTEDPMLEQPAKKRKRSGKERQQKKAEAIAAAEAAAQAEHDGFTADASGLTEETPTEGTDMQGKQVPEGAAGGEQETNADEHQEAIGDETIAEPSDVFDLEKVQGRVVSSRLIQTQKPCWALIDMVL
jgi:NADPH-dependent glutamate synthase beta subunit-like oxidoreductase